MGRHLVHEIRYLILVLLPSEIFLLLKTYKILFRIGIYPEPLATGEAYTKKSQTAETDCVCRMRLPSPTAKAMT